MKRLLLVLAACTSPKMIDTLPDDTLAFTPAKVTFNRQPINCGPTTAPFSADDTMSLQLSGAADSQGLATTISVVFHSTLPVGQALPVNLGELMSVGPSLGQSGTLPLANNEFTWIQGPDPNEVDAQALTDVSIRIDQMPAAEGELGVLTIRMAFADGGIYDVEIGSAIKTPPVFCGGGGGTGGPTP